MTAVVPLDHPRIDPCSVSNRKCAPPNPAVGLKTVPVGSLGTDTTSGLTLTGGLPFFGGAGNNYSMHGVAETVARMRSAPGQFGLVGANGGIQSKYSVGIYSTAPAPWRADRSAQLQEQIVARPSVAERAISKRQSR